MEVTLMTEVVLILVALTVEVGSLNVRDFEMVIRVTAVLVMTDVEKGLPVVVMGLFDVVISLTVVETGLGMSASKCLKDPSNIPHWRHCPCITASTAELLIAVAQVRRL